MWTIADVATWVDSIGMGQYRKHYVHNSIDGPLLMSLTHALMKEELKIGPFGHRESMVCGIQDLQRIWGHDGGSSQRHKRQGTP